MKTLKVILLFTIIIGVILTVFRMTTNEDDWICENGQWVEHGHPNASKPTTACPGKTERKEVSMKLTSSVFSDNQAIPVDYTCRGRGLRPTLMISDVPAEAKALAVTMDDPDAPVGTFHHWLAWNIPVTDTIPGTSLPEGLIEGTNSAGRIGYFPPCPPSGTHRYIFTVYALDQTLQLPKTADTKAFQMAKEGHIMAQVTLTGIYGK